MKSKPKNEFVWETQLLDAPLFMNSTFVKLNNTDFVNSYAGYVQTEDLNLLNTWFYKYTIAGYYRENYLFSYQNSGCDMVYARMDKQVQ